MYVCVCMSVCKCVCVCARAHALACICMCVCVGAQECMSVKEKNREKICMLHRAYRHVSVILRKLCAVSPQMPDMLSRSSAREDAL